MARTVRFRAVTVDRQTLLGVVHAERQRLGRTVQYAEPQTWEQPSALPGWWNRDVMAHLASHDTAAAQLAKGDPAEEFEEYRASLERRAVHGGRVQHLGRRPPLGSRHARRARDLGGKAADAFLAYMGLLTDDEWEQHRFAWLAGDIAARYLVQSRMVEWWIHGEDMRATNGLGPEYQHWPIHATIDLGVRMLPWALGEAGFDLTGNSVSIEVDGAGGGSWHWGLGAGEVPPADKRPDTTIVGRAPQLALVAARRVTADDALASGNLVVGLDAELGAAVLRHIRAFV